MKNIPTNFLINKDSSTEADNFINFKEALQTELDESFERFEFDYPLYILYSSGTTGKPKCITHGAGMFSSSTIKNLCCIAILGIMKKYFIIQQLDG